MATDKASVAIAVWLESAAMRLRATHQGGWAAHSFRGQRIELLHRVVDVAHFIQHHGATDPCANAVGLRHEQVIEHT